MIYDQARSLAEHYNVELLSWKTDSADVQKCLQVREPRPFSSRIQHQTFYAGRRPESTVGRVTRVGRALVTGQPSPALFYYPIEDISRWAEVLNSQPKADLGIYHYSFAALWKQALPKKFEHKSICYLHNLESDLFEIRASKETNFFNRSIHSLNASRLKDLEQRLLEHFDELWFISEADRQDYMKRYSIQSDRLKTVVPTFDPQIFSDALNARKSAQVLTFGFLGKLDFEPNRQGIMWFIKEVAPLLATRSFQGQVWIGGKNADAELKNAALKFPFIHFKGFVNKLSDWYQNVDVSLVPHFQGSGTRIKLLDALSFATPVICTPAVTERIEPSLANLPAVLVRQSPNDWAETLLNQELLKQTISTYTRFPQGLDGEVIYSFLKSQAAADKAGEETKSKSPPLDR